MMGVAVGSVANWIDQHELRAGRTPGGHRRIQAKDLLEFLRARNLPVPPELNPPPPRALVVDDEKGVTTLLSAAIRQEFPEYEVIEAHDGFAAGEWVASTRPRVVILDLRMPGMDGFEVCRRIKSREDGEAIAVIAVTAHPSPEVEQKILQCGASALLTKPVDLEALMREFKAAAGIPERV